MTFPIYTWLCTTTWRDIYDITWLLQVEDEINAKQFVRFASTVTLSLHLSLTLESNTWDSDKHEQSHMYVKYSLLWLVLGNSKMALTAPSSSSPGRTRQREVLRPWFLFKGIVDSRNWILFIYLDFILNRQELRVPRPEVYIKKCFLLSIHYLRGYV